MKRPDTKAKPATRRVESGFSLIEILAVMAIIALMMALLLPAIKGMTGSVGRKGAVNTIMNTLEQARAAALETGSNVYVLLWKRQFPDQDSLIVFRDAVEWNLDEKAKAEAGEKIYLSRWIKMPKNVLLYDGKGRNIFNSDTPDDLLRGLPKLGNTAPSAADVGYMKFSPSGSIVQPSAKEDCRLFISEGIRGKDRAEALFITGFDVITFRRFIGRASVDVSLE